MQDKPLDRAERDLLAVLQRLEGAHGPVSRDALSVEARGRGLEFGRSFARLKTLALIEEVERRPFILLRMFGAKSTVKLRLTPAGRRILGQVPVDAAVSGDPVLPVKKTDAKPAIPPGHVANSADTARGAATAERVMAQVASSAVLPKSGETHLQVLQAQPDLPHEQPDRLQAHPDLVATSPDPAVDQTDAGQDVALPTPGAPPEKPAVKAVKAAKPPRRLAPGAFTEVLGGVALANDPDAGCLTVDPQTLQMLRDTLSGLGIDLTLAGEMLVADRMAKGATAAEALSQVVVFAFAHVVQHDLLHGRKVEALGLPDYAVEVRRELQRLRDAGEIGAPRFDADMAQLGTLIGDAGARGALAEMLLRDPVGGAAPPAVLPADLHQPHEA